MKNIMKKMSALLMVCALAVSMIACGNVTVNVADTKAEDTKAEDTKAEDTQAEESATPNIDRIKEAGVFIFGTESTYPPYQYTIINEKGEMVYAGLDVDMAKKLAERLGVEYKQSEMAFDSLIPALQGGQIDMAGSFTPTEERDLVVDFSQLYKETNNVFMVRIDEKDNFKDAEAFVGKGVGAQMGTVQDDIIQNDMEGVNALVIPKVSTLVQELFTGNIDAICVDSAVADCYLVAYPDQIAIAEYQIEDSGVAMCVIEGASDLMAEIDAMITEMMESGELEELYTENIKAATDQIIGE